MNRQTIDTAEIQAWLRKVATHWQEIEVEPTSPEGAALNSLIRCGIIEAIAQFVLWHPKSDHEIWLEARLHGFWTSAKPPEESLKVFGELRPSVRFARYKRYRLASSVKKAVAGEVLTQGLQPLTPEIVMSAPIVPKDVEFLGHGKRVKTLCLFYSRGAFGAGGQRKPIPIGSIFECYRIQGFGTGGFSLWNVAELEPVDYVPEEFDSSSSLAFAFGQSCHKCSSLMHDIVKKGMRGDINSDDGQFTNNLGRTYADLWHQGQRVLQMYKRVGRNCDHIASLVARPLGIRNIDLELLHEIDAVAVQDFAFRRSANAPRQSNAEVGVPERFVVPHPFDVVVNVIRMAGKYLETFPETFGRFGEEDLRNLILSHLSLPTNGMAAAEQFRKHGKTDICIPFLDGEAFVAECKMWKGPQECAAALDQLMSYVTPRDRYGALIIFNRDVRSFTKAVVETATSVFENHALCLRALDCADYSERIFEVQHKDDEHRKFIVHLFPFNLFPNPRQH